MTEKKGIPYKWLALATVAFAPLMGTLDSGMVSLALPSLNSAFNTTPATIAWVFVAYLLAGSGLTLPMGKLGDTVGRKKVYTWGCLLVALGLVLCSLARTALELVIYRAIQGAGMAMVTANGLATVVGAFPPQERGKALGLVSTGITLGLSGGPFLGGVLLDTLGWRAVFYGQLPVSVIASFLSWRVLREQNPPQGRFQFDFWGAATLFGALAAFLLAINRAGVVTLFSLPSVALALLGLLLFGAFLLIERGAAVPIVELSLFRSRLLATACLSHLSFFMSMAAITFLIPFYLIETLGFSPTKAGLVMIAWPVFRLASAPGSGWLSDKTGSRLPCTLGLALVALSFLFFTRLGREATAFHMVLFLAVLGFAWGLFEPPNNSAITGSVPRQHLGTGAALVPTMRLIASSVGVTTLSVVFASRRLFHASQLGVEELAPAASAGGIQDAVWVALLVAVLGLVPSILRGVHPPVEAR